MDNTFLVALAGSVPLCKLIETIRVAVGVWYLPHHIREKAKADAEAAVIAAEGQSKANVILAESQAQAMDIEAREKARIAGRERRRQKNIEAIADKTAKVLPEAVSDQPVDDDWVARFFENCQDIGDDEMQNLWAKLLAGEVARPGSFSLRTLELVKVLRKEDAHLFTRFCSQVWLFGGRPQAILYDDPPSIPEGGQLTFEQVSHLHSLGLLQFENLSGFTITFNLPPQIPSGHPVTTAIQYFGVLHLLKLPPNQKKLIVGKVLLTALGTELTRVAGGEPNEDYRARTVNNWRKMGIEVTEPPLSFTATT